MYVSLVNKRNSLVFPLSPFLGSFTIKTSRDGRVFRISFLVSCYPCGRVKLVAPCAGFCLTGDVSNNFKDVVFDSVRSIYTLPGLSVITPSCVIYSACGRRPRRCW